MVIVKVGNNKNALKNKEFMGRLTRLMKRIEKDFVKVKNREKANFVEMKVWSERNVARKSNKVFRIVLQIRKIQSVQVFKKVAWV